jgi:hypothetical protein
LAKNSAGQTKQKATMLFRPPTNFLLIKLLAELEETDPTARTLYTIMRYQMLADAFPIARTALAELLTLELLKEWNQDTRSTGTSQQPALPTPTEQEVEQLRRELDGLRAELQELRAQLPAQQPTKGMEQAGPPEQPRNAKPRTAKL